MTGQVSDLMGLGMPGPLAVMMGANVRDAVAGTGTSQATGTLINNGDVIYAQPTTAASAFTVSANFPIGGSATIYSDSVDTLLLFPPSGAAFNGGVADASVAILHTNGMLIQRISTTDFRTFATGGAGLALPVADAITAAAGGGQTNATQLTGTMSRVATVATGANSVKLPLAQAGMVYYLRNSGANSMQVFGAGTDTINAVATATGVAQAAGASGVYFCTASAPAGKWFRVLSA